ncbi:MAG: TetR family transcriptional regulator [Acidimicrobiales bacterium]|nr:TetR family transcriptional regulator [Acidimicrobiales bacterium]
MGLARERGTEGSPDRLARRAERRASLLDAAISVVRRDGAGVSMEAMAAAAGVTKPILYRHFGDRDGLIMAMAGQFAQALTDRLAETFSAEADAYVDPRERLRAGIEAYVSFIDSDTELYRFLVQHDSRGGGQATISMADEVARRVAVVLGETLAAQGRDSGPAEAWAYGIVGMIQMAGDWWVERQTMTRSRLVDELTRLLWSGLDGSRRVEAPPT